jgi:hypothetical protein
MPRVWCQSRSPHPLQQVSYELKVERACLGDRVDEVKAIGIGVPRGCPDEHEVLLERTPFVQVGRNEYQRIVIPWTFTAPSGRPSRRPRARRITLDAFGRDIPEA